MSLAPPLRVRALRGDELGAAEIAAWRELEDRALEPNVYLSPDFVLPALRHLDPGSSATCVLVESADPDAPGRLLGVGVLVRSTPSLAFPLRHVRPYTSQHSYRDGLLLDPSHAAEALRAMLRFLSTRTGRSHGLFFRELWSDGPTVALLRACGAVVLDRRQRAVMVPRETSATHRGQMSGPRQKRLRRHVRGLAELGSVSWAACGSPEQMAGCIERHLDLEHMGWKGESGTSLRSTAAGTAFFREAFSALGQRGRALFTELSVGGRVVASTSNLVSGTAGFAFKLGWEPSLAALSPGKVNEMYFIAEAPRLWPQVEWVDSGAAPGSFIEQLWLERHELARVIVPLTTAGRVAIAAVDRLRRARRRMRTGSLQLGAATPAGAGGGSEAEER